MSNQQPPRKTPSQPNGVRTNNSGHAKKARSTRSNSTNKTPTPTASDGYAMGSYDNEPVQETIATPSWMRSTPAEGAVPQSPSSPVAGGPAYSSPLVPTAPASRTNMVAPVPFHLHPFAPSGAPTGPMPPMNGYPSMTSPGPMGLSGMPAPIPVGMPPNAGAFGVNPIGPAYSQGFGPTSASAPPQVASQDTIARILALQHANSSMSQSNTPQFAAAAASSAQTPVFPSASSNPHLATPVGNPFAAPTGSMPMAHPIQSAPPGAIQPSLFPTGVQTSPPKPGAATPIFLDHLLPPQQPAMQHPQQQQQMDLKLWMDQFKVATQAPAPRANGVPMPTSSTAQMHHHQPHHFGNPQPTDSLYQLQQQMTSSGQGKPVQLTLSNEGHIKVTGPSAADMLFEPPSPSRSHLKTSGKNIPNPRTAQIHAHHNYGVPAQP